MSADVDVAVIGAGIVGTSCALSLQAEGLRTVLVDPHGPGAGTAVGSAGYLHDGEIFPLASPGLLKTLPSIFFDPLSPLVIRPSYAPQLLWWGWFFLRTSRVQHYEEAVSALARVNRLAIDAAVDLARQAGAEDLLVCEGGLKVCRDQKTLEVEAREVARLEREGIPATALDANALHKLEPSVARGVSGAIYFPKSGHVIDLDRFGERLGALALARGGSIRARAKRLVPQRDRSWVVEVDSDPGEIRAAKVVVAAGAWSAALLRPLGYRVPLASGRGYHLMIAEPGIRVRHPIIFHEPHFAATPMQGGLRLAGTMEFAFPETPPDERRAQELYELASPYFSGLQRDGATTWMGVRPVMPDSVPAIGADHNTNLYYSFGHGHLGLTQAAISARCVANLLVERTPPFDMRGFSLARFTR